MDNIHVSQSFDCRTPVNPVCCVSRAVAVVRSAPCGTALRRQSPAGPALAPLFAVQERARRTRQRIVRQAVAIRNTEVGRTQLRSGGAMLPRLGQCLAVRRVDGAPSPSRQRGGLAAGRSRRLGPNASGASPWPGACSLMRAIPKKPGWSLSMEHDLKNSISKPRHASPSRATSTSRRSFASNRRCRRRSWNTAATATASWPSPKSTPTTIRSPSPTANG